MFFFKKRLLRCKILLERIILQKVTVVSLSVLFFFSNCNQAYTFLLSCLLSPLFFSAQKTLGTSLQNQVMFIINIIQIGVIYSCWPLHEWCRFQGNIWGPAEFAAWRNEAVPLRLPFYWSFVVLFCLCDQTCMHVSRVQVN